MREHPHSTTGLLAATAIGVAALVLVLVPSVFFGIRYVQSGYAAALQDTGLAAIAAAVAAIAALLLFGAFPLRRMRGIEVEVAVRLRKDLLPRAGEPDADTVRDAIGAVLPAIEVVETRLADWRDSAPLAPEQ